MIALRYGAIPIVTNVGGLHDTIGDIDEVNSSVCGQGIVLHTLSGKMIIQSVKRALQLFALTRHFSKIAKTNMTCDVSFEESAKAYLELYRKT